MERNNCIFIKPEIQPATQNHDIDLDKNQTKYLNKQIIDNFSSACVIFSLSVIEKNKK